jgi:hypothetical protein
MRGSFATAAGVMPRPSTLALRLHVTTNRKDVCFTAHGFLYNAFDYLYLHRETEEKARQPETKLGAIEIAVLYMSKIVYMARVHHYAWDASCWTLACIKCVCPVHAGGLPLGGSSGEMEVLFETA